MFFFPGGQAPLVQWLELHASLRGAFRAFGEERHERTRRVGWGEHLGVQSIRRPQHTGFGWISEGTLVAMDEGL